MANDGSAGGKKKRVVVEVWFLECPLFGGKNMLQNALGPNPVFTVWSLRWSLLEVAGVLQVWDFNP